MDSFERARSVLEHCDGELRKIAETALASGDFDAVMFLTTVLKDIASVRAYASDNARKRESTSAVSVPTGQGREVKGSQKAPRVGHAPGKYPRFRRDDEYLVKIGWSKKSRGEYEHRASLSTVLAVAEKLALDMIGGRTSRIEDLPPIVNEDGSVASSYQVYLAVAWLRAEGLVNRIGRKGYSSSSPQDLAAEAEDRFRQMTDDKAGE